VKFNFQSSQFLFLDSIGNSLGGQCRTLQLYNKLDSLSGNYPPKSPLSKGDFQYKTSNGTANNKKRIILSVAFFFKFHIIYRYMNLFNIE